MLGVSSIASALNGGRASESAARDGRASSSVGASSAIVRLQVVRLRGQGAHEGVEVRDQALKLRLVALEAPEQHPLGPDQPGEVVRALAEQGLVDDRRVATRRPAVAQRLVERLGAGLAVHVGVLADVVRRGRLVRQRGAEARERLLQALARWRLQRRQHLVDLHGRRRLRHRDVLAVVEDRGARAARVDVEEEVALQEQARPDLDRRVGVDRLARLVDAEGHVDRVALALDRRDLADVDARNPHRRRRAHGRRVLELRRELEALAGERDLLREGEVDARADDHRHDQPPEPRRGAGVVAAVDPRVRRGRARVALHRPLVASEQRHQLPTCWFLVFVPWLPGTLPNTTLPTLNGSLPASHSNVWPGAAVFGYGLECRKFF